MKSGAANLGKDIINIHLLAGFFFSFRLSFWILSLVLDSYLYSRVVYDEAEGVDWHPRGRLCGTKYRFTVFALGAIILSFIASRRYLSNLDGSSQFHTVEGFIHSA